MSASGPSGPLGYKQSDCLIITFKNGDREPEVLLEKGTKCLVIFNQRKDINFNIPITPKLNLCIRQTPKQVLLQ